MGRKWKKKTTDVVPVVKVKKEIKKAEPKPDGYVRGRPTLYRSEYCEQLIEHCREGGSIEAFAGTILVSIDTLYEWVSKHQEFSEAKKVAYTLSLGWWENFGRNNLLNMSTTTSSGRDKETTSVSLNSSVWIYNMKCRFRRQYTEIQKIKQIVDEKSNQTQTIKIAYVPKSQRVKTDEND